MRGFEETYGQRENAPTQETGGVVRGSRVNCVFRCEMARQGAIFQFRPAFGE